MTQNPLPQLVTIAKLYSDALGKNQISELSQITSLYLVDCLENASYGFDQYLKERAEFQSRVQIIGEICSALENGDQADVGRHQDAMHSAGFASVYHVRAVYGELWNASENARVDLSGAALPELKGFKPRSVTLVRNQLIVHQRPVPISKKNLYLGRDGNDGYALFPDRDLDGKGNFDNGIFVNVQEYVDDLKERMLKYLKP